MRSNAGAKRRRRGRRRLSPGAGYRLGCIGLLAVSLPGCSRTVATSGVENVWRDEGVAFTVGQATRDDVLSELGPPSQVIALEDETIFYYVQERMLTNRLFLIVYNTTDREILYDRAVFFFDAGGILTAASMSEPPEDAERGER